MIDIPQKGDRMASCYFGFIGVSGRANMINGSKLLRTNISGIADLRR
ncbi:hypothetical protein APA_829 [Pseudanabaena sp. lw0831]|nr:hypothetical protein [Pseudanabaena sp. lw0831]GBO53028.1 hypothetical protein APA_829 [Pseudanabaena sp. lw0831]